MSLLDKNKEKAIEQFWQNAQIGTFKGVGQIRIAYVKIICANDAPNIVISTGRSESYLKYQEVAFDLVAKGFNVFIHDHRGQGLSQRMLRNPHKGYVKKFDDYAEDLKSFINNVVKKEKTTSKTFILAHSMGCAITIRTLQKYPDIVSAAVLCSPMIAINTGKIPSWFAHWLITLGSKLNRIVSKKVWYFPGQGDYRAPIFKNNPLMHCQERFQRFVHLYQLEARLQLGGVTFHWLRQTLRAKKAIFTQLQQIKVPITALQAEQDTVVCNQAQNTFCQQLAALSPQLTANSPVIIQGAKHELLFESEEKRSQAMAIAVNFFQQQMTDHGE